MPLTWKRRLQELAEIFAVSVGGFAVLDNHLHLLVRLDPAPGQGWSDEEVVCRWGRLFPPRDMARQALPVTEDWVQARPKEPGWVARARQRLQSLSWFMKCLVTWERLRAVAKQSGVHHLANLGGCRPAERNPTG
jgi:hypothetical protein